MKLVDLIIKLSEAKIRYHKKHGVDPEIFYIDREEGILLCSRVKKSNGCRVAKKPYMHLKIKKLQETL